MAYRVTVSAVRGIIDTALTDDGVTACIAAANALINSKPDMLSDLTSETLGIIELWLSAHNVSVADPRVSEEKTRETGVKYVQPAAGKGLEGSSYGQTAILLDTTLTLNDAPSTRRANYLFI